MPEPPLAEGKVRIIRKCKLSSIIEKPHLAIELGRDCLRHRAGMLVVDRNLIQRLIPLGGSKNHKRLNAVRKPRLLEARTPSRSISNRTISYNSEQESCDQVRTLVKGTEHVLCSKNLRQMPRPLINLLSEDPTLTLTFTTTLTKLLRNGSPVRTK